MQELGDKRLQEREIEMMNPSSYINLIKGHGPSKVGSKEALRKHQQGKHVQDIPKILKDVKMMEPQIVDRGT